MALVERIVLEALDALRWREIDLAAKAKGHRQIAHQLRTETPMRALTPFVRLVRRYVPHVYFRQLDTS